MPRLQTIHNDRWNVLRAPNARRPDAGRVESATPPWTAIASRSLPVRLLRLVRILLRYYRLRTIVCDDK